MKTSKFFTLLSLGLVLGLSACKTQQNQGNASVNNSPSATAWKNGVKGTWILKEIEKENFPQNYTVKNIFEEAPAECFLGSIWTLPNNGNGNIQFEEEGLLCAPGAIRNIHWSIYNPGKDAGEPEFQFKKIYPGDKASQVVTGYRMQLAYADEETLVMKMPIKIENRTANLIFNFVKY